MISTPCSTGGSQTRCRALQVEAAMDRLLGGSGGRAVLRVRVSDWAVSMNLFVVSFSSPGKIMKTTDELQSQTELNSVVSAIFVEYQLMWIFLLIYQQYDGQNNPNATVFLENHNAIDHINTGST